MSEKAGTGTPGSLKQKDLVLMPHRVALALQDDGWWVRNDIIWAKCLSGGTTVYAKTQKGEMPMKIKDMVRLDPKTVKLWDGEKWNQVVDWEETPRPANPVAITLRSGERIGCTPDHKWPTESGLKRADELEVGDVIQKTELPESDELLFPSYIDESIAWLLGLYLAEGSRSGHVLQFAGHKEEATERKEKLERAVRPFGGTVRVHDEGNMVVVDSPPVNAIVDQYIHGNSAKNKGIKNRAWKHNDDWLQNLIHGYLQGDGHWDEENERWRLSFTRNDRLAQDIRTLCARLGYTLTLKKTTSNGFGEDWPSYRGEIRASRSGHHNERKRNEIVSIGRSRARKFWDITVEDDPHVFALASGILSHNSNPMPESVTDRCTTSHEHIFLLTKSKQYKWNQDAIRESFESPNNYLERAQATGRGGQSYSNAYNGSPQRDHSGGYPTDHEGRNKRDVWTMSTKAFPGDHFATFPPELPETCIKAGTDEGDIVLDPFAGVGTVGVVAKKLGRKFCGIELNEEYCEMARQRINQVEWNEGIEEIPSVPDEAKFLLSIDGVGTKTALTIWNHFNGNIYDIVTADGDLLNVDGVGEKTKETIQETLREAGA